MNENEVKRRIKALWKETFRHDSDEYINLIFDTYFHPSMVEYEEQAGDIVAAMLAVPYSFGNAEYQVEGLYLCGLATNPRMRGQGIMTRLLDRINARAAKMGYAFTFLIPADEGLQLFYRDRGYVNAFYRVIDNYTSIHDFDREYESILAEQKEKVAELKRRVYASLTAGRIYDGHIEEEAVAGITRLITDIESRQADLRIMHSPKDIVTAIRENILDGGTIHYVCSSDGDVTAAAFTTVFDKSEVRVHKMYSSDTGSKYRLMADIKSANAEIPMAVYVSSVDMDRKALWSRTYGSELPEAPQVGAISMAERVYSLAAHSKVYGMVRILNLAEILKFMAVGRRTLKYSILVKETPEGSETPEVFRYAIANGKLSVERVDDNDLARRRDVEVLTLRDIASILFRRRDGDVLITEAFGIPSINASISLMLD